LRGSISLGGKIKLHFQGSRRNVRDDSVSAIWCQTYTFDNTAIWCQTYTFDKDPCFRLLPALKKLWPIWCQTYTFDKDPCFRLLPALKKLDEDHSKCPESMICQKCRSDTYKVPLPALKKLDEDHSKCPESMICQKCRSDTYKVPDTRRYGGSCEPPPRFFRSRASPPPSPWKPFFPPKGNGKGPRPCVKGIKLHDLCKKTGWPEQLRYKHSIPLIKFIYAIVSYSGHYVVMVPFLTG